MKKTFLALLLLVGAVAMASVVSAREIGESKTPQRRLVDDAAGLASGMGATGTSASVYDTVWVGLSSSNHYSATTNPNNIWVGNRFPNVPGPGISCWDWDTFGFADGGNADSLQGWLPYYWNIDFYTTLPPNSAGDMAGYSYVSVDQGNRANNWIKSPYAKNRGVIGVWHSDPGVNAGIGTTWSPIGGGKSAWCGLREHGDNTQVDAVTLNPFNSNCMDWSLFDWQGPTVTNWPGYSQNWDQMLYRDIAVSSGQDLTVAFNFRTRMSTKSTTRRIGWFHGDPLNNVANNYYSAFPDPIVDSFQVYIGVPVNDDAVTLSDGSTPAAVYDKQRRWFDEVLQIWDAPYLELTGAAGCHPVAVADTDGFEPFTQTVDKTIIASMSGALSNPTPGYVRLVFRVKTNNIGDDVNGDNEVAAGGRGAAMVDDVTTQWGVGSTNVIGDFEGADGSSNNTIDNSVTTLPANAWRSTGRPAPLWVHARPVTGLPWADLCGLVGSAGRVCNMQGGVLDFGADGYNESIGIKDFPAFSNNYIGAISPAIDLTTVGGGGPNAMGIDALHANPSDDYYLFYEIYAGAIANQLGNGVYWWYGVSSYPDQQPGNLAATWGPASYYPAIWYTSTNTCKSPAVNNASMRNNGAVYTSNVGNTPDSLRLWLSVYNYPVDEGLGSVGANPTGGVYWDNIALGLVNKSSAGTLGNVTLDAYSYFCDAFPPATFAGGSGVFANIGDLDTCGAHIHGPLNIAQLASAALLPTRNLVLSDSIYISAPEAVHASVLDTNSTGVRVDMIFRILPGVGNYRQDVGDSIPRNPANLGMHLLRTPNDQTTLVNPLSGTDHSFWASYMRDRGAYSKGDHYASGGVGTFWDCLTWNSARCDTAGRALWPNGSWPVTFPTSAATYATNLHPDDPHFTELGISKHRCFIVDTLVTTSTSLNVSCDDPVPAWLTTVPQTRTGWDGSHTTIRGTKIIPDGLLTPGSHVQYFFRKQQLFGYGGSAIVPDTNIILNQAFQSNTDGHRWEEFSILPDRYKAVRYGGAGDACMLVVDGERRRGDARVWVSMMDSIGGTDSRKWGANNGWHAPGNIPSLDPVINPSIAAQAFVYDKNGSAGTLWDFYRSNPEGLNGIGNRFGGRTGVLAGAGLVSGKDGYTAPTPYMLKSFYRALTYYTADLKAKNLGPETDIPENDWTTISNFLTASDGIGGAGNLPRSLYLWGQGIAQSENIVVAHRTNMSLYPGVVYVSASYAAVAANVNPCSDLTTTTAITPAADVYGVGIACTYTQNVVNSVLGKSQIVSFYQDLGHGPYGASILHPAVGSDPANNYIAMTDAFRMIQLWGRFCSTSKGRLSRTYNVMSRVFNASCSRWTAPSGVLNVPNVGNGGLFANYLKIGNSVMRAGNANVKFGVAASGRVRVRLYDVTGRLVRTLADKTYQGGQEYSVNWDGRSDAGSQVARGVYFARIDYASGNAINGRVVVLQ